MGDLRNGQAIQTIFPASTRLPFPFISSSRLESVSSTKEVLLMKQDFHNTDLASSKPCCVQFTQRGRGREGSLMELWVKKEKEREKQKQNHPKFVFSQTKGETEGWYGLQWGPSTVRRWWLGTTSAESDCQHLLTASSWIFSGPCTCPHRGEKWPKGQERQSRSEMDSHLALKQLFPQPGGICKSNFSPAFVFPWTLCTQQSFGAQQSPGPGPTALFFFTHLLTY